MYNNHFIYDKWYLFKFHTISDTLVIKMIETFQV